MCTALQRAAFTALVHTADAGGDHGSSLAIEPGQFAADLHGQLARGCDDKGEGCGRRSEMAVTAQKCGRDSQAEADRFARPCLGRNQQIDLGKVRIGDGLLHGGQGVIALGGKRICDCLDHGKCPVLDRLGPRRAKCRARGPGIMLGRPYAVRG